MQVNNFSDVPKKDNHYGAPLLGNSYNENGWGQKMTAGMICAAGRHGRPGNMDSGMREFKGNKDLKRDLAKLLV